MNSFLIFLLKSTLSLSMLYLAFSVLMRKDTFFKLNRMVMLFMVLCSVLIPFLYSPQLFQPIVRLEMEPIFQNKTIFEELIQEVDEPVAVQLTQPVKEAVQPVTLSASTIFILVYLLGVFVSFLLLAFSIASVLLLFRKALKTNMNGIRLMIVDEDIPAFSFGRNILISQHDFDTNSEAILTHEQSHIRLGHFYDLILMELIKIVFWFNPLVYRMVSDLKEIHEFQADDHTLNSGIDANKYQILIIQKSVGHQKFALANSFNHCQIKNRITMMNKQKTSKAWRWKVATFLPLLALLLMAFGKTGENVLEKVNVPEKIIPPPEIVLENQNDPSSLLIEIRKDGNYIDNKLCSLEVIVKKGQDWGKASNDWIHLRIDQSIPYSRIDEIREQLEAANVGHVTQSTVNSDEIIYPAGDVTEMAKFSKGSWYDWMENQLEQLTEGKNKEYDYTIIYSFIIDKNGKVRDAHIIKGCDHPDVNAAMEKIIIQIPDWKPATKGGKTVSVLSRSGLMRAHKLPID